MRAVRARLLTLRSSAAPLGKAAKGDKDALARAAALPAIRPCATVQGIALLFALVCAVVRRLCAEAMAVTAAAAAFAASPAAMA